MLLVLVRHGRAARSGAHADADRPLTRAGEVEVLHAGQAFARLGLQQARLWTSPALRCRRTAELLASSLDLEPPQVQDALAAGGGFQRILAAMLAHVPPAQWILVGHQPDLEDLAQHLLGADSARIALHPGGCVAFDCELGSQFPASLRWALPPEVLRGGNFIPKSH